MGTFSFAPLVSGLERFHCILIVAHITIMYVDYISECLLD